MAFLSGAVGQWRSHMGSAMVGTLLRPYETAPSDRDRHTTDRSGNPGEDWRSREGGESRQEDWWVHWLIFPSAHSMRELWHTHVYLRISWYCELSMIKNEMVSAWLPDMCMESAGWPSLIGIHPGLELGAAWADSGGWTLKLSWEIPVHEIPISTEISEGWQNHGVLWEDKERQRCQGTSGWGGNRGLAHQ